ncbi:AGAP008579-PA-like protein [Anopheles sinensis]|uniref:AGAP008579-PA-like protein n=1 Tax=Anopheles sinensis TaxID=74873 RepID=A0A084VJA2_ANOSI|nr:AGAP008579-PA-like protein [Anopheles sinensis]
MKLVITIAILCLGVSLSEAGRPASTEVVQKLKAIEPIYKDLQDTIVNAVAGAKLNTASKTDTFYQAIISNKEASLKQSVQLEDAFSYQLNNQAPSTDSSCLAFLRTLMENNMNVAGVGYTNCVNTVEAGLKEELDKVYKLLQVDESELFDLSLLDVFRGENIIADPVKIIAKLNEKEAEINGISLSFVADINAAVDGYATRLSALENSYKSCVLTNESLLKQAFDSSKMQLTMICMGTIV